MFYIVARFGTNVSIALPSQLNREKAMECSKQARILFDAGAQCLKNLAQSPRLPAPSYQKIQDNGAPDLDLADFAEVNRIYAGFFTTYNQARAWGDSLAEGASVRSKLSPPSTDRSDAIGGTNAEEAVLTPL